MDRYHVSEYESGWFVEEPDPNASLEECKFITIMGPYKTKQSAQRACDRINAAVAVGGKPVFIGKRMAKS